MKIHSVVAVVVVAAAVVVFVPEKSICHSLPISCLLAELVGNTFGN